MCLGHADPQDFRLLVHSGTSLPLDASLAAVMAEQDACKTSRGTYLAPGPPGWGPHPRLVLLQGGGARLEKVASGTIWAMTQSPSFPEESLCPSTPPLELACCCHSGQERRWPATPVHVRGSGFHASCLEPLSCWHGRLPISLEGPVLCRG